MRLIQALNEKLGQPDKPFLIQANSSLTVSDLLAQDSEYLKKIAQGDVVAVVGDMNLVSIHTLLHLFDRGAIVVPLTGANKRDHPFFFESACVEWVVEGREVSRISHSRRSELIDGLRLSGHPGLVLFSTGTTGKPKAILHDMSKFISRYLTPRPALRTLGFLSFDHIGGLNTLFHTLFNGGVFVTPGSRSVDKVLQTCALNSVELLPTTPTFLRLLLLSGLASSDIPKSLKIITYGTERMDPTTLETLATILPEIDFRQTYGMTELGILRVKSKSRNSLFMKVGGEGVQTRVTNDVLEIKAEGRMLGYLNAATPFDADGWYNTGDVVDVEDDYIRIVGRARDTVNVGGLKFSLSDVEDALLRIEGVSFVKTVAKNNPVTGQHVEATIQLADGSSLGLDYIREAVKQSLPRHMRPLKIVFVGIQFDMIQ